MPATLLLAGLVNMTAGALFAYVGLRFVPRRTSRDSQLANQAFATYWTCMGLYHLIDGAQETAASVGYAPFDAFLFLRYLSLPILTLAVGGVTFYFVYLFTGRQTLAWPVVGAFSLVLMTMTFHIRDREPIGVIVSAWNTDLLYARPYESLFFDVILLALVLPPIVGAAFYLRLRRSLTEPHDRRRVLVIGWSILLWSLAAFLARALGSNDFLEFLSRPVLGLLAAASVLAAYRMPLTTPIARASRAAIAEQRRRALDERVGQLL